MPWRAMIACGNLAFMGKRSTIEIDHAFFQAIQNHPTKFIVLLCRAMSAGDNEEFWKALAEFGIRRVKP